MDEDRTKFLEQLHSFISESKTQIQTIATTLQWTEESLLLSSEQSKTEVIPNNELEEIKPPVINSLSGEVANCSNECSKGQLYNEIVKELNQPIKSNDETKEKSYLEELAAQRDAKRRRISYKNKVHTKNKSYTEVLREVIMEQMATLGSVTYEGVNGSRSEPCSGGEGNTKAVGKEVDDLLEIKYPGGNPHKVWEKIDRIVKRLTEKQSKRSPLRQKDEKKTTNEGGRRFKEEAIVEKKRRRSRGRDEEKSEKTGKKIDKEEERWRKRKRRETAEDGGRRNETGCNTKESHHWRERDKRGDSSKDLGHKGRREPLEIDDDNYYHIRREEKRWRKNMETTSHHHHYSSREKVGRQHFSEEKD